MRRRLTAGNGTTWTRRPPLEAMPTAVRKLMRELAALERQHSLASNEALELRARAHQDDAQARRADAAQAAEAARAGKPVDGTPNLDALRARREAVDARVGALKDAIELVRRDATAAKWQAAEEGRKAAAKARAELHAAGEAMEAALLASVQATALSEWLEGEAFDCATLVPILDLNIANVGPSVHSLPPASALALVEAVAHMTDPAPEETP